MSLFRDAKRRIFIHASTLYHQIWHDAQDKTFHKNASDHILLYQVSQQIYSFSSKDNAVETNSPPCFHDAWQASKNFRWDWKTPLTTTVAILPQIQAPIICVVFDTAKVVYDIFCIFENKDVETALIKNASKQKFQPCHYPNWANSIQRHNLSLETTRWKCNVQGVSNLLAQICHSIRWSYNVNLVRRHLHNATIVHEVKKKGKNENEM